MENNFLLTEIVIDNAQVKHQNNLDLIPDDVKQRIDRMLARNNVERNSHPLSIIHSKFNAEMIVAAQNCKACKDDIMVAFSNEWKKVSL